MAEVGSETLKTDIDVTRKRISEALQMLEARAERVVTTHAGDRVDRATRSTARAVQAGAAASAAFSVFRNVRSIQSRSGRVLAAIGLVYGIWRLAVAAPPASKD